MQDADGCRSLQELFDGMIDVSPISGGALGSEAARTEYEWQSR
jgi:hypothetical protein